MVRGAKQRKRSVAIMVREPYTLPAYLSDLGGNDPAAHHGEPHAVIRIVRRYLHVTPRGRMLPGPQSYIDGFNKFKADLPGITAEAAWGTEEIDPFQDYRAYLTFLTEFLKAAKRAPTH